MTKVADSYPSLMQGVSQQIAQDRQPGQHTEQVNMIPDPVQGLSRRHGSRWVAELQTPLLPADFDAMVADTASWRSFDYSNQGSDYTVLYRAGTKAVGSTLEGLRVYNRTTKTWMTTVRNVVDAQLDLLEAGGISAITSVGKYVFMAGYTTAATVSSNNVWADATNQARAAVWIRGGAYNREFKVVATKTDNTVVTFSYTTPTASYPETLDTSSVPPYALDPAGGTTNENEAAYIRLVGGVPTADLSWSQWDPTSLTAKDGTALMTNVYPAAPASNMEYAWTTGAPTVTFHTSNLGATDVTLLYTHTKTITNPVYAQTVSELTNAFTTATTEWIGSSADAIRPNAIAESLRLAAVAAGLTSAVREEGTILFDNIKTLVVTDAGDGSLIRGVANEITALDQVTDIHYIGKITKVRARNAAEAYYLKAVARDPAVTSGYDQVTWVEGAGVEHTITNALLYATVSGSSVYVASSAALLNTILPGTHPTYNVSTVGDIDSSPLPFFVGKQITYLGVFQDRLLIGSGAVIRASKTGDYLNFFRSSVLTAPGDDPLEMLSQGSEDDVLRYSVLYDRDLVIFADKRQYAISGRTALTPTSANMQVMSSHANAAQVPPLAVGSVIFYGQLGEVASSVHQIQPGQVAESPESYLASSQIDTYLLGNVIELANHAKPTHLFVRTTGSRNSLYVFSYLDKDGEGRVQAAWHRWDYDPTLGPIIGMQRTADGLLVFTLRKSNDKAGVERVYLVADLQPLTTGLARYPYLDSIRPLSLVTGAPAHSLSPSNVGPLRVAFDATSEWQFLGDDLANHAALTTEFPDATGPQVGYDYTATTTPTNPFLKGRDGRSITSGTLTIGKLEVGYKQSCGFWTDLESRETTETQELPARVIGSPDNVVGRETISTDKQSVVIALETREYTLTLRARKWLPLILTSIDWVGQVFNRSRRF